MSDGYSGKRRVPGFTLLELMISMTVLGIIMTLVFGAMRLGTRTWETGQARMERWQRRQATMDLIARQLGSIYLPDGALYVQTPVFSGGADRIACFSSLPLIPTGNSSQTVFVRYRTERDRNGTRRLLFVEKFPDFPDALRGDEPADEEWDVLADGLAEVEFAYLETIPESDEDPWEWTPEWEPVAGDAPLAIRISVRWEEEEPPMNLVIPIHRNGVSAS